MRVTAKGLGWSILLSALLVTSSVGTAATVITTTANVNTPVDVIYDLTSAAATGLNMAGLLQVTVHFANAPDSTVLWGTNQASAAAGTGTWTLAVTGNTGGFNNLANPDASAVTPWTLTNTSTNANFAITGVELNGLSRVVFDRDLFQTISPHGQEGTPGSLQGIDFETAPGDTSDWTLNVQYSRIVQVSNNPGPCVGTSFVGLTSATGCGDTWGTVTFTFTGGPAFYNSGTGVPAFHFFQDTDLVGVPEPLTSALMGIGLLAIAAYRKRLVRRSS